MKSTLTTVCRQPYDVKRKETSSAEETCILKQTFARVLIFDAVPRVICERWSACDGDVADPPLRLSNLHLSKALKLQERNQD
jgi:hypothetical protein